MSAKGLFDVATLLAFLAALAERILQRFVQGLWDALWEEIFRAVTRAEEEWKASGQGQAKKAWVMEQVMKFVDERAKLNWLERLIVQMFVSKAVDALIATVNEELGHNWVEPVRKLKEKLAAELPLVE